MIIVVIKCLLVYNSIWFYNIILFVECPIVKKQPNPQQKRKNNYLLKQW